MGPGTQGLSFLKKAPEEIKLTKKKENAESAGRAQRESTQRPGMSSLGPDPPPFLCSLAFGLGGKTQTRRKQLWKESRCQQGKVSPAKCWRRCHLGESGRSMPMSLHPHNPIFARTASAHLHDKPQTLCSSQGACSWGNPAQRRKPKIYGTTHKIGEERVACEPSVFWNKLQPRQLLTTSAASPASGT